MSTQFLGIGKTKFNSSVCLIDNKTKNVELLLTERLNRKKNSGAWPELALKEILPFLNKEHLIIGENRDVHQPYIIEEIQNQLFPFYDYLKKYQLDFFLSKINPQIKFISHHLAHAYAALAMSPFEKSIIVVLDGAGTEIANKEYEECSVYLQNEVELTLVSQRLVKFEKSIKHSQHTFGNKIGACYEKASEFIFNSPHSSGKVMGLAAFGENINICNYFDFQEGLEWNCAFKGKTKKEWELVDHEYFKKIAFSVQTKIEEEYCNIVNEVKINFPDYENLILTGGCALNCTSNAKLLSKKIFNKIFVPPFPGDESIGFGVAHYLKYMENPSSWEPLTFENQAAYFGSIKSVAKNSEIEKTFDPNYFIVQKNENYIQVSAELLEKGNIIAWFQGRSESGPRALGNRSILVRPDRVGIKEFLNNKIKFREKFRPYGCSVLYEKADIYFDIEPGFNNPYMSYAIKVRSEFLDRLKEVTQIDGTSRMQTVRIGQNKKFYNLIRAFGDLSGLYCLLNTSLNVMDEPMVETLEDAKRFLENVEVDFLVIENYIIEKKNK